MLKLFRVPTEHYWSKVVILLASTLGVVALAINHRRIDWGSIPDYFGAAGVALAVVGLDTWRRQLKGTHDFELGRRILKALYGLRDAIRNVRNPFMEGSEATNPEDPSEPWQATAYQRRWDKVAKERKDLNVALLEAEAVWGPSLKECDVKLHRHTMELFVVIRHYIQSIKESAFRDDFTRDERNILYGLSDDTYDQQLELIIKSFEDKIRPKFKT